MEDSIQSSLFYGSWSSRYYGHMTIFGSSKVEFGSDPTLIKLSLTYSDQCPYRRGMTIDFNLKLSRNEYFCYGISIDDIDQKVFLKIDLSQPMLYGQYLSLGPYDDGIVQSNNRNLSDFIMKNISNTDAEEPTSFQTHQRTGTFDCCDVLCAII